MFDDEKRKKAIEIMDKLISRPASAFFRNEVIPGIDSDADYGDIIKNPQDLETIKRRIKNGEYTKLSQWMTDVETVWNNAEVYNGTESYIAVLSREMRAQFEKERRVFFSSSVPSWISEVYRLRVKLENMVQKAPRNIHSKIPGAYLMDLPIERTVSLSEHEIQCLKIALEMLSGPATSKEIMRIIREKQPSAEEVLMKPTLNIGVLDKPTIEAIQAYAKQALENQGLKYPE